MSATMTTREVCKEAPVVGTVIYFFLEVDVCQTCGDRIDAECKACQQELIAELDRQFLDLVRSYQT